MRVLNSAPLGVYAVYKESRSTPTSLMFVYVQGDNKSLHKISLLHTNPSNYSSTFAMDLRVVARSFSIEKLIVLRLPVSDWVNMISVLSDLHLSANDVSFVQSDMFSSLLPNAQIRVRTLKGSFKHFIDTVKWFDVTRGVYNPLVLSPNCMIDVAPSQFKTVYVNNIPVCYWNTSVELNNDLRDKVDSRDSGIIINAMETKQVLTSEMTRHKFVSVGERLIIDYNSGLCMREVGKVDNSKTTYISFKSTFDSRQNYWIPSQESFESIKILGMRSV